MYYAGIDIGTSKVKFVVYNNDLLLKEYEKKQSVIHNEEGNLISAKKIIENVYSLFKEAFSDYPEIAGVSITSFGESFVCLDENDEPLFDIPLFIDKTGLDELDFIKNKIDERKLYQITGCPLEAMYSLPKILSLKHKYKDSFSKTKKMYHISWHRNDIRSFPSAHSALEGRYTAELIQKDFFRQNHSSAMLQDTG